MKKIVRLILFIIAMIITSLIVILLIFLVQKEQGKVPYFFTYTSFIATGNSMNPTIKTGDLIIIKKEDTYQINDIIVFHNDENRVITHRIYNKTNELYNTKGDNNQFIDGYQVNSQDIYGKMIGKINNVGSLITFIHDYLGLIISLIISLFILIFITTRRRNVR